MAMIGPVPTNIPAQVFVDRLHHHFEMTYDGRKLFTGHLTNVDRVEVLPVSDPDKVYQTIVFHGKNAQVEGRMFASSQSFAAETEGIWQRKFPLVRNSDGPSHNLRNNAVYDRQYDLLLSGPADGSTRILPTSISDYEITLSGTDLRLVFRPLYYQRHKNISFFEPWKHPLTKRPISGWCSWWAYRDGIDLKTVQQAANIFAQKLKPFGYDVIQLDDGYESGVGAPPNFWLTTDSKFPGGLKAVADCVKRKGLSPGIWVGTQIFDEGFAKSHPNWFARDANGEPHKGPWIGYGVDGNNKIGLSKIYGRVWDAFKEDGFNYVKIDSLRHLLYDSLYPTRPQIVAEDSTPEIAFRKYLQFARSKLGPKTYILACWGVLPEAVGIVDACRLGGDGFGPSTMQQYNSWNNVVWRNDPDHVDLEGADEAIIRPTLVSMAGAQLLLSDKVEFYEDDAHLEGAKRASPVPYTLPGQLYDFDPSKTDNLIHGLRNQHGGAQAGPLDADQHSDECPWWQLDVSRPFENWTILARLSWKRQPLQNISFSVLGLDPGRYAVYEFWSKKYLGEFVDKFPAEAQAPKVAHVYCIRKVVDHPQVVSTSRHITQGGPDLLSVGWSNRSKTLRGVSQTVANDPYEIRIRCDGLAAVGSSLSATQEGDLVILRCTRRISSRLSWWVKFR
jgi:alpha-galactosidase